MALKKSDYYKVKNAFAVMYDGEQIVLSAGEIVRAGHPIMKGRDEHFEPVENFGRWDREVEQTTSNPGESRGGDPAKKRAPLHKDDELDESGGKRGYSGKKEDE